MKMDVNDFYNDKFNENDRLTQNDNRHKVEMKKSTNSMGESLKEESVDEFISDYMLESLKESKKPTSIPALTSIITSAFFAFDNSSSLKLFFEFNELSI